MGCRYTQTENMARGGAKLEKQHRLDVKLPERLTSFVNHGAVIEAPTYTSRTITALYRIDGFKRRPLLGHCTERREFDQSSGGVHYK